MGNLSSFLKQWRFALLAYAILLLIPAVMLPFRLAEILQLAAMSSTSLRQFWEWVIHIPGSAPIGNLTQYPFVAILGHSPLMARMPSVLFALGAAFAFYRLAQRLGLLHPAVTTALFLALPLHYRLATEGRPFELALVVLLLATTAYLELVETASVRTAVRYGLLLTACLYIEPLSYLPAVGYLLFLLPFVNRANIRRSFWHALPATVTPALLFLPYLAWANGQDKVSWIFGPDDFFLKSDLYRFVLRDLTATGKLGFVLSPLLLAGMFCGFWRSLRFTEQSIIKKVSVTCLLGGAVSSISIALLVDNAWQLHFSPDNLFWAVPALLLLVGVSLDWMMQWRLVKFAGAAIAFALALLCIAGNVEYVTDRNYNLQELTRSIQPQFAGSNDSCVVFVSEGLSESIFSLFQPDLRKQECLNFFHHRVVLAVHPFVRPDQQDDAETYFHGLNFAEVARLHVGGGEIIVLDQKNP